MDSPNKIKKIYIIDFIPIPGLNFGRIIICQKNFGSAWLLPGNFASITINIPEKYSKAILKKLVLPGGTRT
jgi:hypothetical protein